MLSNQTTLRVSVLIYCYDLKEKVVENLIGAIGASVQFRIDKFAINQSFSLQDDLRTVVREFYENETIDEESKSHVLDKLLDNAFLYGGCINAPKEAKRLEKMRDKIIGEELTSEALKILNGSSPTYSSIFSPAWLIQPDKLCEEKVKFKRHCIKLVCRILRNFSKVNFIDAICWLDRNKFTFVRDYPDALIEPCVIRALRKYRPQKLTQARTREIIKEWKKVFKEYKKTLPRGKKCLSIQRLTILFESLLTGKTYEELNEKYGMTTIKRILKRAREYDIPKLQNLYPHLLSPIDGTKIQ